MIESKPGKPEGEKIDALLPRDATGEQFVLYGDSCSGIPGADFELNLAAVNAVLSRLQPHPAWVGFIGDEIMGMTNDHAALREQWKYWRGHEMAWLDRRSLPLYSVPSNHTTYDVESEAVWRENHPEVPSNGPPDQEGLSYFVRRGSLLIVCMDTSFSGLGGNGHVEHSWLEKTLTENADATYKLVFGHYPAFPVNGYDEYPHWRIVPDQARQFWSVLKRHEVLAYVCSHVIAFDAQVHSGVLQLTTGGAGTSAGPNGFMRGPSEYHHLVQMALDRLGIRFQVLDATGTRRESLSWPFVLPPTQVWRTLQEDNKGHRGAELPGPRPELGTSRVAAWRFAGTLGPSTGVDQTLVCGSNYEEGPPTVWVGFVGAPLRLVVRLLPEPGSGAQEWTGDVFQANGTFDFQIAVHTGMGPGGVLYRRDEASPWSSLTSSSARGAELLLWPQWWVTGHGRSGTEDAAFRGSNLRARGYWEDLAPV